MMMNKNNPLKVVASVPLWENGEYKKSLGWALRVDFSGLDVPNFRGAVVNECYTAVAPEEYAEKCSFVTRVEYLFRNSRFVNNYKRMCKVQSKINDRIKDAFVQDMKSKIIPVSVQHYGFLTYGSGLKTSSFWKMSVAFEGNITDIFKQRIAKECDLLPKGAYVSEFNYNPASNTTNVIYEFEENSAGDAVKRANKFEKQVVALKYQQLDAAANAGRSLAPVQVSGIPNYDGYASVVSVKYQGDFDTDAPHIVNRFKYRPLGAAISKSVYNQKENTTDVEYSFKNGIDNRGAKRAWDFIDKMHTQLVSVNQDENIK